MIAPASAAIATRAAFVGVLLLGACVVLPLPGSLGTALAEEGPTVLPVDGDAFVGELESIEDEGYRFRATGDATRTLRDGELIRWGLGRERPRQPLVSLVDGSILAGEIVALGRDAALLDSRLYGELSVPIGLIRGVALRPSYDPRERDATLAEIAGYDDADDRFDLIDGPPALGVWSSGPDSQPSPGGPLPFGTRLDRFFLERADADAPLEFARRRVRAIYVAPAALATAPEPAAGVWWGFEDGTLLRVVRRTANDDVVRATLACDLTVSLEADEVRDALKLIEPFGRTTALSSLPPQAYRQTTLVGRELPLGIDASSLGGRLRVGGGYVVSGVGMHARSRVVFAFDGSYRRFVANLGVEEGAIDEPAGEARDRPRGSIVGAVYLLRDGDWTRVAESPVVRGGERSRPFRVDVEGARALMLVVEEADGGDVLDRGAWLDATLVP